MDKRNSSSETWKIVLDVNKVWELVASDVEQAFALEHLLWQPNEADKTAAWQLYTELRTRITTQALPYRYGDEGTALDSIYRLFELSRNIIKANVGCTHFATLTTVVLNGRVRPFTAKWHGVQIEGRLASADVRYAFREELSKLREILRRYTRFLGILAEDQTLLDGLDTTASAAFAPLLPPKSWEPLQFGITNDSLVDNDRENINRLENADVQLRRKNYGNGTPEGMDAVGLAISGGGIRSATFSLGVVQYLSRKGILQQVDFLSTVSGGGYIGTFISSFLNANNSAIGLQPQSQILPFGAEEDGESLPVRHLRNHSKYLSEGGFKTIATMISTVCYGITMSVILITPVLLALLLLTQVSGFEEKFRSKSFSGFGDGFLIRGVFVVLVIVTLSLPIVQNYYDNQRAAKVLTRFAIVLSVFAAAVLLCSSLPLFFFALDGSIGIIPGLVITTLMPIATSFIGLWLGSDCRTGRLFLSALVLTGPLFFICAYLALCYWDIRIFAPTDVTRYVWTSCALVLMLLYTTYGVNINLASPHRFYRNRLARTYMTRMTQGVGSIEVHDPQLLSGMNTCHKAPYHLINAALNIPACPDPNLRGRNTDFFLFSKYYSGSPILGYSPTIDWERQDKHLDLGTAMAISGAAAAPRMGTLTSHRYTFLLAMMNVRLGYWLRRPDAKDNTIERKLHHRPPEGWQYFLRELTGLIDDKSRFVNVSDGGHIENLGIYELLRRRCKFIIAIDGEADPTRSFGGLVTLMQLAFIDLGVRIEPDLADLRSDQSGHGRAHFGMARIDYRDGEHGILLYIKSSLTGNESEFLCRYRAEHPDFPHQSTTQQLFSETQFEAYRSLGEHIATDLFRPDLVGEARNLPVRTWFARLAEKLM